ncbi:MAG: 50S ribosomal protein L22 [Bradymonadales bacterium]|nr:MAG: 50S ribosomal protein L22 [Bradymonadales bacterium]
MEARAKLTNIRLSPRKLDPVARMVRGKPLALAIAQLAYTPRKGARILQKVLESARANASERQIDVDTLKVKAVEIGKGPTLFRIMTRQRGSAHRIQKRTSHISVVVED